MFRVPTQIHEVEEKPLTQNSENIWETWTSRRPWVQCFESMTSRLPFTAEFPLNLESVKEPWTRSNTALNELLTFNDHRQRSFTHWRIHSSSSNSQFCLWDNASTLFCLHHQTCQNEAQTLLHSSLVILELKVNMVDVHVLASFCLTGSVTFAPRSTETLHVSYCTKTSTE